jgi:hypothetical protein
MDQHGVFSFYWQDGDGNWWEIVQGRSGGYSYLLDEGRDITGRTDLDADDMQHVADAEQWAAIAGVAGTGGGA